MIVDALMAATRELYHGNGLRALRRNFPVSARHKLFFIDHHEAHAWSTYAVSGFDDALVLVVDGRGARQATSLYHGREGRLNRLRTIAWPNSLGSFYEAFTDLLGFERHGDEWKVMGLAAYGEPTYDLDHILKVVPGGYRLNSRLVLGRHWNDIRGLEAIFGTRRDPEKLITDDDRNLAASVQKAAEAALFELVREGVRLTGCRRVCLAGGVAMNQIVALAGEVYALFAQGLENDPVLSAAEWNAVAASQRDDLSGPLPPPLGIYTTNSDRRAAEIAQRDRLFDGRYGRIADAVSPIVA